MKVRKITGIESRLFILISYYEIHAGRYMRRNVDGHDMVQAEIERMMIKYRPISLPFPHRRQKEKAK